MTRPTKLRAFDNGRDRWEIAEAMPQPMLMRDVEQYSAWREHTQSFSTRRELAATCGVFIVNLGATLEIVDAKGTLHRLGAGEGFIGGMAGATSLSRSTGEMAGLHVHMSVENLAAMFGVSLAAIIDITIRLEDIAGEAGRALGGRLAEANDTEARFTLLDAFIGKQLADRDPVEARLRLAFERLRAGEAVSALADDLGWSRKRLARWFRDRTGLKPQQFSRLARFERFTEALQSEPKASLAELAGEMGYADQAHLTHDVRRLSQMTPGELRGRLIPEGGGVRN